MSSRPFMEVGRDTLAFLPTKRVAQYSFAALYSSVLIPAFIRSNHFLLSGKISVLPIKSLHFCPRLERVNAGSVFQVGVAEFASAAHIAGYTVSTIVRVMSQSTASDPERLKLLPWVEFFKIRHLTNFQLSYNVRTRTGLNSLPTEFSTARKSSSRASSRTRQSSMSIPGGSCTALL